MSLFRRKAEMVDPDNALPGRSTRMPLAAQHFEERLVRILDALAFADHRDAVNFHALERRIEAHVELRRALGAR